VSNHTYLIESVDCCQFLLLLMFLLFLILASFPPDRILTDSFKLFFSVTASFCARQLYIQLNRCTTLIVDIYRPTRFRYRQSIRASASRLLVLSDGTMNNRYLQREFVHRTCDWLVMHTYLHLFGQLIVHQKSVCRYLVSQHRTKTKSTRDSVLNQCNRILSCLTISPVN